MFQYHDAPVKHLALEEKYFWSVCPGENAVIRYACQNMKVDLRIGGKDAQTFVNPRHICQYNGDLYVACGGNKIRKIDGMDYTVSDYRTFSQQVKRYHKFGQYALVGAGKRAPTWWTKPKNNPYIRTRHTPACVCLIFMPFGAQKSRRQCLRLSYFITALPSVHTDLLDHLVDHIGRGGKLGFFFLIQVHLSTSRTPLRFTTAGTPI